MGERLDKLLAFHAAAPGDDFTTYAVALEYAAAGESEQALAWLDRTLALAPDHAYAWYQKAAILADEGALERAHEAVRAGLAAAQRAGDARAAAELRALAEGW